MLAGRKISESEVAALVRQAGFPESVVGKMVCTAKYESSFYERASNHNRNGTYDYGLFQINSTHLREAGCPSSSAGLYDAEANARCAYRIYKSQGINAWYGYQRHRSECNSYRAPASGGAATSSSSSQDNSSSSDCWSGTLDEAVSEGTCVESKFDGDWYQCNEGHWYAGGDASQGPYGACTSSHPL